MASPRHTPAHSATTTADGRRRRATGRTANGSGSVVPRTPADGSVVYDVYWTHRDTEGAGRRGVARGFRTAEDAEDAEKQRRAVTATTDTGRNVPPQDMTLGEHLSEQLDGLRLKP